MQNKKLKLFVRIYCLNLKVNRSVLICAFVCVAFALHDRQFAVVDELLVVVVRFNQMITLAALNQGQLLDGGGDWNQQ